MIRPTTGRCWPTRSGSRPLNPASAIALGGLLGAVFLVLVGAMLWQELRGRSSNDPTEFVIDDAVKWVLARLDGDKRSRLGDHGVRAILEWQVFGLQRSVKGKALGSASVVMGPTAETVDYIRSKIDSVEPEDITAVLTEQFGYLESIGAVAGEAERTES